jgi:hypothetical protein
MKVIKLTAENLKRLRAVEIEPDTNVVVISGRNGQGKTSVLDAIWFALGGAAAARETTKPIRDGEHRATVTLDLGDFTIKRVWEEDKSTLSVVSKDGAKYNSPQKFLDEKLGALSFDPLAFAGMAPREQRRVLLEAVDVGIDIDELDRKRAALFDQRTETNRQLRDAEGVLAGLPDVPEDTPDEEISPAALIAAQDANFTELSRLGALRDRIEATQAAREQCLAQIASFDELLASLAQEIPETIPEPIDTTAELARISSVNAFVRTKKLRYAATDRRNHCLNQAAAATASIEVLDQTKQAAIAEAALPIDGLGFDEEGVTYQGIPFKQCSGAEQLRVSLAMAMALNPTIRIIRVSDGSLLDSENMAVIAEMAKDQDFQVWLERVDESGAVGFTIEDGEVKA